MLSFKRMPRNFVFGFGFVRPSRSDLRILRSLMLLTPFTFTLAPVYNLSPAGTDFVLLQPHHSNADTIQVMINACLISTLYLAYCYRPLKPAVFFYVIFP